MPVHATERGGVGLQIATHGSPDGEGESRQGKERRRRGDSDAGARAAVLGAGTTAMESRQWK